MPTYYYNAKNEAGATVSGHLSAINELDLEERLQNRGLFLISAKPGSAKPLDVSFERINRKDLITFTIHLATVLSAGVPMLTGLEDLCNQTEKEKFRLVIEDLLYLVQSGLSLSEALERHPEVFSELYVNMVRAGEATGNVEGVLKDLVSFLEWQEELSSNILQALIYPSVLLGAISMLVIFLFTFVLPRFVEIFQKSDMPLPMMTRIVLGISSIFTSYWYILLVLIISSLAGYRLLKGSDWGRYFIDRVKLNLPIFGQLIRKIALSRFSHHLGALTRAGVDITQSLWIAEKVIGNEVLSRVIRNALVRLKEGERLSVSLSASGEFPPLILRMLAIGEQTGSLEMTLEKVSQYYDREVPATIRRIFAIIEPVIIIVLGLVIIGIAISVYVPLYQMVRLMPQM